MNYSIFIFTITHLDGDVTITQMYCKSQIRGFMAMGLIFGCMDSQIDYCGQEYTCEPLKWDYVTNKSCLNN